MNSNCDVNNLHMLSGSDAILLGAETVRGLYPIETISTVGKICAEVHFILHLSLIMNHFEKFMLWLLIASEDTVSRLSWPINFSCPICRLKRFTIKISISKRLSSLLVSQ